MEIKVNTEEGFADITLPITEVQEYNNQLVLDIGGTYNNTPVGFEIQIPKEVDCGIKIENDEIKIDNVYKGLFVSYGEKSDNFLNMLAGFYKVSFSGGMKKQLTFTFLPMKDKPSSLKEDEVRAKLFFEEPEEFYCEVFLNFHIKEGFVELHEKDQEYRENLIEMLGEV